MHRTLPKKKVDNADQEVPILNLVNIEHSNQMGRILRNIKTLISRVWETVFYYYMCRAGGKNNMHMCPQKHNELESLW